MPISTSGNQRCARCSRIAKALNANTLCARRAVALAGPRSASSSSTAIWTVRSFCRRPEGFQRWLPSQFGASRKCRWGWRCRDWRRNSTDWHRLFGDLRSHRCLILDEDGIYIRRTLMRLLLGLKATMSEAELHILRCGLPGGI